MNTSGSNLIAMVCLGILLVFSTLIEAGLVHADLYGHSIALNGKESFVSN